jgi:hypothetical protein
VTAIGLGLKHSTASITYVWHTLQLLDGAVVPINMRLLEVETAKEKVSDLGIVQGIHPIVGLSSGLAFYTVPLLFIDPAIGAPVWGIKFIVAPSANPEIYFPAGTEMVLQLTAAASIPAPNTNFLFPVTSLSPADQTDPEQVLQNSSPRAYMGKRASDVINVLLIGSRNQIDRAFYAAGWAEAQRKSPLSGTLLRKSDHESHLP